LVGDQPHYRTIPIGMSIGRAAVVRDDGRGSDVLRWRAVQTRPHTPLSAIGRIVAHLALLAEPDPFAPRLGLGHFAALHGLVELVHVGHHVG
jgi:hypothetical protein